MAKKPFISTKLDGVKRLARSLKTLAKKQFYDKFLERFTIDAVKHLKRKPYPPRVPDQSYVRKERLGRGYRARDNRIFNVMAYAPYVVEEGAQARVHKGRWWTVQGELQILIKKELFPIFSREIDSIWSSSLDR